jgi:hypothetical protein
MTRDRNQTTKSKQARTNRPPKSLRWQVKRALRKATIVKLGTVAIEEDGRLTFRPNTLPDHRSGKSVYLWSADLPRGLRVECLLDRPIRMDKQSFFSVLVESLASAIHRGNPTGGLQLDLAPKEPRAAAVDGETGCSAAALLAIARLLHGVALSRHSSEGGAER